MAANEVATIAAVRATFLENIATIRQLKGDADAKVSELVTSILAHLERGRRAT
jgi:hypothetical protein